MVHNQDDLLLLKDIVDCCIRIVTHTKKTKYYYFERDYDKQSIIERLLEIIGQAAKKISEDTHKNLPNIPWKKMIGLRNKLAHDYGEILKEWLLFISQNSIPDLLIELEKIEELKDHIVESKKKFGKF